LHDVESRQTKNKESTKGNNMIEIEQSIRRGYNSISVKFFSEITELDNQSFSDLFYANPKAYYTIDLEKLRVLNSSDIGLLLRLYHSCKENSIIKIKNCNRLVLNSLYISNTFRIFYIPQLLTDPLEYSKKLNKLNYKQVRLHK